MKIVIPVAGFGTRLKPHTFTKPKPLLHVAGKTVLEHVLDSLKELEFDEVIFITGHLKEKIEAFMKDRYAFKCTFIEQKVRDGTAGAIRLTESIVSGEELLIVYADTIFEADFDIVKKAHADADVQGIIWVKEVEDYQRFGVAVLDAQGFMTKFVEKPDTPISKLANIGVYYIKDSTLLFAGINHIYTRKITTKGEFFLTDAIQYMIDHGAKIKTAPVKGWYDCGAFGTLLETNRILLEKNHPHKSKPENSVIVDPVFIDDDVVIDHSIIGPNVSIAKGCEIKNSIVRNSIIDTDATLDNINIINSTIGAHAVAAGSSKKMNIGDSSEVRQ